MSVINLDVALEEVRCRCCRRLLGLAPANKRIYCDEQCATDFPAVQSEDRDALIEAVFQCRSNVKALMAKEFGVSRQRIDQILAQRDLKVAS